MLSPHRTRLFLFVILLLFITWPVQALERGPQGTIRVGVFPVEPLTFVDKQGIAQGLFPDLLREIVKDESWAVAFVPGSWAEGLERLQSGEIDLMLSVAYSPERAEIMDFNYESVAELWGQVFVNPQGKSKNINDLDGRKVAVMRKDITASNFIMTTEKLGVRCEIVEFATHAEVFTAVKKGAADAGVAPQHIGLRHAKEYNLVGSAIIFSPFSVFFASKKGTQHELLSHIDAHITHWKKDSDSLYYNRLNYWIGGQNPGTLVPVWLIYASIIGVFVILLFVGFTVLLKRTVSVRTKELRESEAVHSKMIANIGDVIVIIDRNGINRYKSPNIEKWFGWKPEDVVGFNTWDNVHPDDLEKGQTFIGALARTPYASGTTEVRYRCKDGSYKWIEITIVNLLHDTSINGFLGNYQDITERKRAEKELAESEKLLSRAQEISHTGSWKLELNTNSLTWSDEVYRIFGYEPQEFAATYEAFLDAVHPDEQAMVAGAYSHSLREGSEGYEIEHRILRRNSGEVRHVHERCAHERDDAGAIIRSTGMVQDITDRKQTESALKLVAESSLLSAQDIFPFLVRQIAVSQGMRYALIARLDRSDFIAHTVAVWCGDRYGENFSYALEGTPCHNVVSEGVCFYPSNIQALFPHDQLLVDMGIESYWGTALRNSTGELLGVMAIMHDQPIIETPQTHAVLQAFALRTSVEMERQQTEKLLRENQEDLKEAQHVAKLGNWHLNIKNNQVVWSDELYKMFGFDPTSPLPPYTEHIKLFTPESWERLSTALQQTKDTGIPYDLELETLRIDGSHGWIWAHGTAEVDATKEIIGLRGVAQDITDSKLAEEALRESDDRHRKYLMNAPHGIFVTDEKGRYQQVNPTACNMSGYEEQELLAMSIADLFFEESIEKGLQHFQRVLHQGQSQGELLFRRKNGERRWWSVNVVKISETQFLGFCIDVTERKQAEELIQKRILSLTQPLEYSEIKLEDLFNLDEIQTIQNEFALATGVASIITRVDGTPVTAPSNFTHLCSEIIRKTEQGCANCIKSDAALGRHNPEGPNVQPCLSSGLWDAGVNIVVGGHHIANWLIGQVRNEAQSEDGLRAYAALIGAEEEPFMQAFREVPSMSVERFASIAQALFTLVNQLCNTAYQNVLQARFISERKQAEKEKDRLQAQLTQAQKMEAVGQLAGGVAHDFNNMLGVIIGYSELILEQTDPSQQFHAELKEILKASRRSADLTRQLLTFARKQTVAPRVLDLNQTIEGMFNMLRRLIGENIDLIWMPGSGLWPINMDPSQIDQILANLCVNARDAIAGVGKLTVETKNATFDKEYCAIHAGSLPGEYVQIAVSDTGSGMDKETLAHIFEPFFTTKDVGEGTGLGLATVYGAVKQNNGFINAYSEPGQGTTFTIYIPRHVKTTTEVRTTASTKPVVRGDEIVLLVEDELTLLHMSKTILERLGYTVLAAGTPSEAIRLAGEYSGRIQLLATDVVMPEMNGRELSARLLESRPEMKCLFMSGYTANIIANQGVLKQGVSFIQKPFSKNQLAAKVREALES